MEGQEWTPWGEGRVSIGAGSFTDKNNETKTYTLNQDNDGEYNHTLTKSEMPSHRHKVLGASRGRDSYCYSVGNEAAVLGGLPKNTYNNDYYDNNGGYGTYHNWIENTGSSQPHSNIMPYIVSKKWKRIN